jgi:hypothetical protein
VVQAEPFETATRVDTDREEAAKLRLFATDAFITGAWAVLTIPGLPPHLASEVLTDLAEFLRPRAPLDPRRWAEVSAIWFRQRVGMQDEVEVARLLDAFNRARNLIAEWPARRRSSEAEHEAYLELSDDVCLLVHNRLPDLEEAKTSVKDHREMRETM